MGMKSAARRLPSLRACRDMPWPRYYQLCYKEWLLPKGFGSAVEARRQTHLEKWIGGFIEPVADRGIDLNIIGGTERQYARFTAGRGAVKEAKRAGRGVVEPAPEIPIAGDGYVAAVDAGRWIDQIDFRPQMQRRGWHCLGRRRPGKLEPRPRKIILHRSRIGCRAGRIIERVIDEVEQRVLVEIDMRRIGACERRPVGRRVVSRVGIEAVRCRDDLGPRSVEEPGRIDDTVEVLTTRR